MESKVEPAISLDAVTVTFGGLKALDRVSLDVPPGIAFGLLGPNGAGKTTMIRLLLGLLRQSSGRVTVWNRNPNVDGAYVRSRCGALLEDIGLYDWLTGRENLEFYARVFRMGANRAHVRIDDLVSLMGLHGRCDEPVRNLSKGMRLKVALARAMLHEPSVLLLDEPTAGLDVLMADRIRTILEQLIAEEKTTLLLATHNMEEAERLCRHVAVIRDGTIIASGHPSDLLPRSERRRVVVHTTNATRRAADALAANAQVLHARLVDRGYEVELSPGTPIGCLIQAVHHLGDEVSDIKTEETSLEKTFLRLMDGQR